MDAPDQPIAEPPPTPPDLLARARQARVMILAIGIFLAVLGAMYFVRVALQFATPPPHRPAGGLFFAVLFLMAGIGLARGKPNYRRSAYWLATVVGFLEAWVGAGYLASIWLPADAMPHLFPHASTRALLVEGLGSLLFGIVLILCGNLLTTALAVFEADLDRLGGLDATVRYALTIAPEPLLAQLREEQWRISLRWRLLGKLALGLTAATAFTTLSMAYVYRDHGPTDADWSGSRARLTQIAASGDTIAPLLAQYHAHHGKYPPWLGALDHDQLHLLPPQPDEAKDPWEYSLLNSGRDYQISVDLPRDIWPGGFGYKAVLCYRSDGHYADTAFGGKLVERFGEWAFYAD